MKSCLLKASAIAVLVFQSLPILANEPNPVGPIVIDGKEYAVDTIQVRQLGPGTKWMRLRLPSYPLNVNLLMVDLNDPNVRIETTQANERLFGTERLVDAAKRQTSPGHTALAGANGNFWVVSQSYPYNDMLLGSTFNANLRNGKILTETNCHADQWDTGPARIGEVGITPDGLVYSDHFRWTGSVVTEDGTRAEVHGANKVVRDNELVMINSYFGSTTQFKPADQVWLDPGNRWGFTPRPGVSTEVLLDIADGEVWTAGKDIKFVVRSLRTGAGDGTLGDADLALVARGQSCSVLETMKPGQTVTLNYSWTTMDGQPIEFDNMIGGNGQVMIDGELTSVCQESENCALVYSKTGYGASADHRRFYIVVIDKSTDPVYGSSSGCTSAVMCQIARYYGCSNMTNLDSGGSAQMLVADRIVNTTTEGTPRAVANGMLVYSVAPVDNTVARLEFDEHVLRLPASATISPAVLAYNKYGHLLSENLPDVTFTVDNSVGTIINGNVFLAGPTSAKGIITANYNGVTVSKLIEVVESEFSFAIPEMLTDDADEPLFFTSVLDDKEFTYRPEGVEWTIETLEGEGHVLQIDENNVMKGLSNGKARVTGSVAGRSAVAIVSVQLPTGEFMPLEHKAIVPDEWKISKTSVKTATMEPIGDQSGFRLSYDVSSSRGPRITLSRDVVMWGCPNAFKVDVDAGESGMTGIVVTLLPANSTRTVSYTLTEANPSDGVFSVPLYEGERDLSFYPVTFKNIQIVPASRTGQYSVDIRSMGGRYNFVDGIENIMIDSANDNGAPAEWYDMRGMRVNPANLSPGIYIRRQGSNVMKLRVNP